MSGWGLAGYAQWGIAMVTSIPIWAGASVVTLFQFARDPIGFLRVKDRSQLKFSDPFPGLDHEIAEVNGVKLHIVTGGKANGHRKPLMLFVHGFPELWYSWRHQMKAFMDEYQVAAFDLRGYGESEIPKGRTQFSMEKLVDDVVGIIRHLGYEKCVLVGHDWGGAIVWRVAMWYPEVIEKLIVLAGPHPNLFLNNMDADQKKRSQYIWLFQAPLLPEIQMAANDYKVLEDVFTGDRMGVKTKGAITTEDIERFKQAFSRPGSMSAALNYYRAIIDASTWAPPTTKRTSHKVEVSTLVLWAADDIALGVGLLRGIEEEVPRVEVHVLQNCSHWVQQDKPEEVNQLMKAFLRPSSSL